MKAQVYFRKFPAARASTLAHLIQQEKKTAELFTEVEASVGSILVADLAEKLPDLCRSDLERIREAF